MPTTAELLIEMRPAWGAALGGRVSPEYLAAFIGRHQRRLEAALEPIAAALATVPTVNVYEVAEDVARRLRGLSEIANALSNTSDNFGIELDRQLPKVMLEYLPTVAGGQSQGSGTPERWAIYRRWSEDSAFRRKLREQVYDLLWESRPGQQRDVDARSAAIHDAAEREDARKAKEMESRTQLQSTRLRNAATKLAERRVKVAADSIALLRRQDVERVLNETPSAERRQVAYVLGERRPELVDEIDEVMREVLKEPANWSTYGRDEIYQPGSRAKREALAEDHEAALRLWNAGFRSHMDLVDDGRQRLEVAGHDVSTPREREAWDYKAAPAREATSAVPWRSSEAIVAEFEVDGTKCTIFIRPPGYHVRVMDGGLEIDLDTLDGSDLRSQAESRLESMLNPRPEVALIDQKLHDSIQARNKLAAERVVHVFTLAARRIADGRLTTKVHSQSVPVNDADHVMSQPSADEAERELTALSAEDGKPRPVIMASLEAGGIVMLSPLGYIGGDLFQTYRDDTSRLQYVSYPKEGNRGVPSKVARAVLALERDGFEVRAEDPEVVKSLIVTGGLDHALAVGLPPPRDAAARPSTRTSDPALIARVKAMAADPPTSTVKYLAKVLRSNGDLPLQVIDWKNGGKRTIEAALEEGEAKMARKLARRPKAERLRDDGVERRAKDANEEHAAQALVQLANMDPDKAREVNEAGFSKSDVTTGHALARRWEATGELTGDEWAWAVEVANKYRRQVGPLPESPAKAKRTRAVKTEPPPDTHGQYDSQSHGDRLATVDGIVTTLKRNLVKLYASYKLEIHATRSIGDNSVTITFYRVPPNADELDAANAKSKVRINIHGEGRSNEPTWSGDQTPARLTAYTVWDVNAPKFRKRSGPIQAIVTAVVDWFILHAPELMGESGAAPPIDNRKLEAAEKRAKRKQMQADIEAHNAAIIARRQASSGEESEEERMGRLLRAGRDVEEAQWEADVERGTRAEIANGLELDNARKTAISNLGHDRHHYEKRREEKWGDRP